MSRHRIINIALLAFILGAMLAAQVLLDGPSDHQAAQAQASSVQDATKAANAEQSMAKARKASGVAL